MDQRTSSRLNRGQMSVSPTDRSTSMPASTSGWPAIDALNWAFSQLARTDIQPSDKLVLLAMASHVEGDDFVVWQPDDAIAELVGSNAHDVVAAIGRLSADGLIRFAERFHDDGSPVYTLEMGR